MADSAILFALPDCHKGMGTFATLDLSRSDYTRYGLISYGTYSYSPSR